MTPLVAEHEHDTISCRYNTASALFIHSPSLEMAVFVMWIMIGISNCFCFDWPFSILSYVTILKNTLVIQILCPWMVFILLDMECKWIYAIYILAKAEIQEYCYP